jgi:hypothetical protein
LARTISAARLAAPVQRSFKATYECAQAARLKRIKGSTD